MNFFRVRCIKFFDSYYLRKQIHPIYIIINDVISILTNNFINKELNFTYLDNTMYK